MQPFGHAAEPWKTFDILCDLERATGNTAAALQARERALQAYLAYRRDGGENLFASRKLYDAVRQAITSGQPLVLPNLPDALQAILAGSRDPALAADPSLNYSDAVEILLLLESLSQ